MKTEYPIQVVEGLDSLKTTEFTVEASAKFFELATNGLYSNPELAVLTELGQNAFDEHIVSNIAHRPFELTLPTHLEPTFVIRDFGRGLSHYFMTHNYCRAFFSTKDEDNTTSGAFGIGRLVALALSSTYNVVSRHEGKRSFYSVFKNSNGRPEIVRLSVEDMVEGEESGLEVSVPVPPNKINQFVPNTQRAFRYYKVRPIVKGVAGFVFVEPDYAIRGNGWAIDKTASSATIISGIYSYPINPDDINNLTDAQRELIDNHVVLECAIGEVTPQPNRQALNYDAKTTNTIKLKLDDIISNFSNLVQSEFDKCDNIIKVKTLYTEYFGYGGSARYIGRILGQSFKPTWNGMVIDDSQIDFPAEFYSKNPNVFINLMFHRNRWRKTGLRQDKNSESYAITNAVLVLRNDLNKTTGVKARVKRVLDGSVPASNYGMEKVEQVLVIKATDAEWQAIKAQNGLDKSATHPLSAIQPPAPTSGGGSSYGYVDPVRRQKTAKKLFSLKKNADGDANSDHWEPATVESDGKTEKLYVVIERFEPTGRSNEWLYNNKNILVKLGRLTEDTKIYGVKAGSKEHSEIQADSSFVSFQSVLSDYALVLSQNWSDADAEDVATDTFMSNWHSRHGSSVASLFAIPETSKVWKKVPATSPLHTAAKIFYAKQKNHQEALGCLKRKIIAHELGHTGLEKLAVCAEDKMPWKMQADSLLVPYPAVLAIMAHVDDSIGDKSKSHMMAHLAHIIQLVDANPLLSPTV